MIERLCSYLIIVIAEVQSMISALEQRCREVNSTLSAKVEAMTLRHEKELQFLVGKLPELVDK